MQISFLINFKQNFFFVFHTFFTISHLFSHLFQLFFCHCTTPQLYQPIKKKSKSIPITVLKFCLGTRFVTSYGRTDARTDARTDELLDHNTLSRPKGPQAKILLLKRKYMDSLFFSMEKLEVSTQCRQTGEQTFRK
jgi:hypothetical protein